MTDGVESKQRELPGHALDLGAVYIGTLSVGELTKLYTYERHTLFYLNEKFINCFSIHDLI